MPPVQDEQNPQEMAPAKDSIGSIFLHNVKALKGYLKRFFGNSQDVDDLLQDVYLRIAEAEKKEEITAPKAFIYKVARNIALNEKSRAHNKLNESMDDEVLAQLLDSLSLEDSFEQQQRFEHFCVAINKLPPQCRKVFILKKIHGLPNSAIAEQLNIAVSTVDKHLAKGLIDCKNELQKMGHIIAMRPERQVVPARKITKALNELDVVSQ